MVFLKTNVLLQVNNDPILYQWLTFSPGISQPPTAEQSMGTSTRVEHKCEVIPWVAFSTQHQPVNITAQLGISTGVEHKRGVIPRVAFSTQHQAVSITAQLGTSTRAEHKCGVIPRVAFFYPASASQHNSSAGYINKGRTQVWDHLEKQRMKRGRYSYTECSETSSGAEHHLRINKYNNQPQKRPEGQCVPSTL